MALPPKTPAVPPVPPVPQGNKWANKPAPGVPAGHPGQHGGAARPKFGSPEWRAEFDKK